MDKTGHTARDIITFQEYCPEGTTVIPETMDLGNGAGLRRVRFIPPRAEGLPELLFLPGLASTIENFRGILNALTARFVVHYVETREKRSSVVPPDAGFGIADIAKDLALLISRIFPCSKKYIILSYSFGATAAAEAIPLLKNKPVKLIMIEPNSSFNFPPVILFLARYFVFMYHPLRPFIKWYMRKYHINIKEDYDMYIINCRTIDHASPGKLAATVLAISGYRIDEVLPEIDVPSVVIGASRDIFHNHDHARQISEGIRDCIFVEMENNKRTHSPEVAVWIFGHLEGSSGV